MNKINITITDDKKEKDQSFEATASFDYIWNNSWNGYGGNMSMTAFGPNEKEAMERLKEELYRYQLEFVKALSLLTPPYKLEMANEKTTSQIVVETK